MLDKPRELHTRRQKLRFLGQYMAWGLVFAVSVFVVTNLRLSVDASQPEKWTVAMTLPWYALSGLAGGFLCGAVRLSGSGAALDTAAFALAVVPTLFLSAWLGVLLPVASINGYWAAAFLSGVVGFLLGVGFRVFDRVLSQF